MGSHSCRALAGPTRTSGMKETHRVDMHPGGASGKESACQFRRRTRQVPSLDREDALEKGMATGSSILAWRIPWTEEPGGLQSVAKSQTLLKRLSRHACPFLDSTYGIWSFYLRFKRKSSFQILGWQRHSLLLLLLHWYFKNLPQCVLISLLILFKE